MRLEIFVLGITAFFIYNTYHDGKYSKMLLSFKKYYKMIFYLALGVGVYLMLKRNPEQGRKVLVSANNMVKYMPIDKSSIEMLSPIFDFTSTGFMNDSSDNDPNQNIFQESNRGEKRMLGSGRNSNARSVSGMKKKYVASNQDWKCGQCGKQLDYTYEVDHKIRLEHGGGNDVQNLIALCRECHGKKTVLETF
jgi:hypothetical protein